jgi:hypothetical protein
MRASYSSTVIFPGKNSASDVVNEDVAPMDETNKANITTANTLLTFRIGLLLQGFQPEVVAQEFVHLASPQAL